MISLSEMTRGGSSPSMLRTAKNAGRSDDQSGATCCITLDGAVELSGYSTVGWNHLSRLDISYPLFRLELLPFAMLFGLLLDLSYPAVRSGL